MSAFHVDFIMDKIGAISIISAMYKQGDIILLHRFVLSLLLYSGCLCRIKENNESNVTYIASYLACYVADQLH